MFVRSVFVALSFFPTSTFATRVSHAAPPNVVFFLIDDLGYADCGFNGGKDIRTPNIDRLAKEGTVIESHYVQPVCSPTRAALMTGRYATKTGVYTIVRPHAKWGLPLQERTLANALKDAGYETAITGKWHLGEFDPAYVPTARGFDHQYGHYFGQIDYFDHTRSGEVDWYRNEKKLVEEGYSTHLVAKEACKRIQEKDKTKPLFLYVPFNGVHGPLQVPPNYLEPYPELKGNRLKIAGMLSAVDEAIGQIVEALEKTGQRQNTLIVFSADNGGPTKSGNSNGPLRDAKGSLYEGGVRGCAFASWPGKIPSNVRVKHPVHIIDWYPTIVKLAGGSLDQKLPLDGRDIWPLLTQNAPSPHEAILSVQSPTRAALRMGDWKLILFDGEESTDDEDSSKPGKKGKKSAKGSGVQLYNLATDLGEEKDLASTEQDRTRVMTEKLKGMLQGAVVPGDKGNEPAVEPKKGKNK
jgi:arylsulfatase A-like enzyme